ncbi:DNA repair protein RecN [Aquabacterium sp.]|uniref:DNA repair protein RecN n=1 Tax=Aquabacterium sp. TaxID=1872578 RepID=UPI0035B1F21B
MLRRLTLRDFVIVPALEIDFERGFSVLTGETGAGKSILIDALQLALGNRADAGVVREGATRAEVCAEFEPPAALTASLQAWLEEAGFARLDHPGEPLLLRRGIDAQGKSRAWINGSPATMTQLRDLGERLVDIHGQHAWQSLTRADSVRSLLDAHADIDTSALLTAWQAWRMAQRQLDDARSRHAELDRERERLSWQINELDKLSPQPDEWDELNAEHTRLSHAQGILDAAQLALDAVSEADESADSQTSRAIESLQSVADFEPQLADALAVLRSAQAQLQDAAHSINAALRHTELDPDRLASLDERLGSWMSLARRYRKTPHELPATLQGWRDELRALDAAADLDGLERAAASTRATYEREAQVVSSARHVAAPKLAAAVTQAMQTLGMGGGRFEIALRTLDEPQSWGHETVEFMVAGHAGSTPRPLGKVASGGELSRIALAIAVCARHDQADDAGEPGAATLIFDEIDSGVGGAVAETVGRMLQRLGADYQVLAVTHLPQVAACGDHHFVVAKSANDGVTTSSIAPVSGDARVAEIARMLGGQLTEAGLAHAREMLAPPAPTRTRKTHA